MSYLVLGFKTADHDGDRVRCATPGLAGEQVAHFLRCGYLWIHIDNSVALERLRTGLDEYGDALPPFDP